MVMVRPGALFSALIIAISPAAAAQFGPPPGAKLQIEKLAAIDKRLLWMEWKAGFWGTVGGILGFFLPASVAAIMKGK